MTLPSINIPIKFPPQKNAAADGGAMALAPPAVPRINSASFLQALTGFSPTSTAISSPTPSAEGTEVRAYAPSAIRTAHPTRRSSTQPDGGPSRAAPGTQSSIGAVQASDEVPAIIQLLLAGARSSQQDVDENQDSSLAPQLCPPSLPVDGLAASVPSAESSPPVPSGERPGIRASASPDSQSNAPVTDADPTNISSALPPGEVPGVTADAPSDPQSAATPVSIDATVPHSSALDSTELVAGRTSHPTRLSSSQAALRTPVSAAADPLQRTEQLANRALNNANTTLQNGGALRVRLDPPGLGKMQIEISSQDGPIVARLSVQNAAARQTLLDNISALHDAIAQAGAPDARIDIQLDPALHDSFGSASDRHFNDDQPPQSDSQGDPSKQPSSNPRRNRRWLRVPSIEQIDIEV